MRNNIRLEKNALIRLLRILLFIKDYYSCQIENGMRVENMAYMGKVKNTNFQSRNLKEDMGDLVYIIIYVYMYTHIWLNE